MRVLLISPNTLVAPYPVYPLGLDYVAGSVAAHHEVKIVDLCMRILCMRIRRNPQATTLE